MKFGRTKDDVLVTHKIEKEKLDESIEATLYPKFCPSTSHTKRRENTSNRSKFV